MLKKKNITAIILSILCCSTFAQVQFKGELDKGYTAKEVYLYKYIGAKAYPFDTLPVKNFLFSANYQTLEKGLYLLGIGEQREDIVLAEEKVQIFVPNAQEDMPWKKQSKANAEYFEIRKIIRQYDQKLQALDADYRDFEYLAQTDQNAFNIKINVLRKTLDSLNKSQDIFFSNMSKTATSTYARSVSMFMDCTGKNKTNYFNASDLETTILASGDFINRKLNYYFMKFGRLEESNIALETQTLLNNAPVKNTSRELLYEAMIANAQMVNENQARALLVQYKSEFKTPTSVGDRINALVPPPAPTIGAFVPDIEAVDKDGKVFKLSDLRGQVVLIDFWASWCGPCRRESPNVVANYMKYKDKGFTILSISADKDKNSWLKAIEQDNYLWKNHLLSAENGYRAQRDFQVQGYPTMFLIDKEGKLISTGNNLRGEGLSQTLASVFAQ